jgi:hypothetical protein
MTTWELSLLFEESYVSLIRAIRTFAYPTYSPILAGSSQYDHASHDTTAIPIFVMRPFRGQLEQATHSVVDRLRFEGDKSVFWLDTSGWLNTYIDFEGPPEDQDFFLDGIRVFSAIATLLMILRRKPCEGMASHRTG